MTVDIRPWHLEDKPNLLKYAANVNIFNNMTDSFPNPYTEDRAEMFLQMAISGTGPLLMAITVDGEPVGSIGLHPQFDIQRKNAELGYWLGEPFWGKGIMTIAVPKMTTHGFKQTEVNRIFAKPFGRNKGSQKVLEKSGYILEAVIKDGFYKNGQYEDELIYAVRRKEWMEKLNLL